MSGQLAVRAAARWDSPAERLRSTAALSTAVEDVLARPAMAWRGVSCGIVVAAGRGIRAGSDEFAAEMEHLQAVVREGPSRAVLDTGAAVSAAADLLWRWPIFAVTARRYGLLGVHGEPLLGPHGALIGAITWYATRPGQLPAPPRLNAQACAAAARVSSCWPQTRETAADEAHAQAVLVARAVDLLMAHTFCEPDEAFALLHQIAADNATTVEAQAAVLLDRATRALEGLTRQGRSRRDR